MKILACLTDGFGGSGGIARYNCELMTALGRSNYIEKVLVLPRFGDASAGCPDGVVQLDAIARAPLWAAKAAALILRGGFDALFCGHLNAAPFLARLAKLARRPLWVQAHGIEAWEDRGDRFRLALSQARLVTAVSRYTHRRMLSWSDINPARARVLPNTFDRAYVPGKSRPEFISRYALEGKRVILTVGRISSLERYKGHDRIIRCLPMVRSRVSNAVYLIVGTGDDQPRLEALACDLGVREAVIFAGQVPDQEIRDHYCLADVFAMPSTGEGFGIVLLEAAASGLPVVGGNRDGSVDALADGAVGTLVDPERSGDLADALVCGLEGRLTPATGAIRRFQFANFARHVDDLVKTYLT